MAGALAGAWLGFHAVNGLLALITALVGTVAGANLALITFDLNGGSAPAAQLDAGSARRADAGAAA